MNWQAFELNEDERMLRESVFRFELEDLGLSYIEDYQTLIDEADQFFFNSKGFRKIQALEPTLKMVAKLMEQGLYSPYVDKRALFTINTIEFFEILNKVIADNFDSETLDLGAGDASFCYYLVSNFNTKIKAVDDLRYGARVEDSDSILVKRPNYDLVENLTVKDALLKYKPKYVISSWLVNPKYNLGDDIGILDFPSVQKYLWIGDNSKRFSSSPGLWNREDFIYEFIDLKYSQFTQIDNVNNPIFFKDINDSKQIMEDLILNEAYRAEMLLITRR